MDTETLDTTLQRVSAGSPTRMDFPGISNMAANLAMSLPTTVFLDTSALAGQQYNFDSTAMRAFMRVARERKLKLLIPDPMEVEVRRQTNERIGDLLTALDVARRKAPFLAGWSELTRLGRLGKNAAENIGLFAWSQFLGKLQTEKLLCSTIATANIITEHQEGASIRLGEGEKRMGTSDALCVAILRDYSARNKCVTAVISEDPDFKCECDRFSELMYFNSISALTELFLADQRFNRTNKGVRFSQHFPAGRKSAPGSLRIAVRARESLVSCRAERHTSRGSSGSTHCLDRLGRMHPHVRCGGRRHTSGVVADARRRSPGRDERDIGIFRDGEGGPRSRDAAYRIDIVVRAGRHRAVRSLRALPRALVAARRSSASLEGR